MKTGTTEKLKFKKLRHKLKLPTWQAVGLLEAIWHVAFSNAPCGDIGRLSDEDIAALLEWDGDPAAMINALVEVGWLDRDDEFRLIVHDWSDHVPDFIKGNIRRHNKQFADVIAKQRKPVTSLSNLPKGAYPEENPEQPTQSKLHPNQTNQTEVCTETPEASSAPPSPRAKVVLEFPCDGKEKTFRLYQPKLDEYRESFPSLDVPGEFRKALQWIRDNPSKRKTAQGMPAFLTRWLGKVQNDNGGGRRGSPTPERYSVDLATLDLDGP